MHRTEGCAQKRTSYLKFLQALFTNLVPWVLNKISYSVCSVIINDIRTFSMIQESVVVPSESRFRKESKFKGNLTGKETWDNLCDVSRKNALFQSSKLKITL